MTGIVLTQVVTTFVGGVAAHHIECECGYTTKPSDAGEKAVMERAKRHGRKCADAQEAR